MLNLIYCELLKLKRSKILFLSILGVFSTPFMLLIGTLQMHLEYPEQIFSLADVYSDSLVYTMLLTNLMIYVAITAYLFSREYTENTLKTILPIPISRMAFISIKCVVLLIWFIVLSIITWIGILVFLGAYHIFVGMDSFNFGIASEWLFKFIIASILMFFTISPFAFITQKTKGFVTPMIVSSVIVMGSVALSNQEIGRLYPWTATLFLISGKIENKGYNQLSSMIIIISISIIGFILLFCHFKKEDLK